MLTDKKAISHDATAAEANKADKTEGDRLRALALAEGVKCRELATRSRAAYRVGNGAAARALSKQGKTHGARRDSYNAQACDLIFRANNRRLSPGTIDLHGLYATEAQKILTARIDATAAEIRYGSEQLLCAIYGSERLLRVIVGRGNHSTNGERKLAPVVEGICRARGLQFRQDETNPGRILISLQPGVEGGVLPSGWKQAPLPPAQAPPAQASPAQAPLPQAPLPQAPSPQAPLPQAPSPQAYISYQAQYGRYQSQYGRYEPQYGGYQPQYGGHQPQYGGPQPQYGGGHLPQYVTNTDRSRSGGRSGGIVLCVSLICLLVFLRVF